MTRVNFASRGASAAFATLLLAGCSGEPSASDITDAMNRLIASERSQVDSMAGALGGSSMPNPVSRMMDMEITDLEKVGCEEKGRDAYVCNVRYTVVGGMFGKGGRDAAAPVHVMRTSDGWMAAAR